MQIVLVPELWELESLTEKIKTSEGLEHNGVDWGVVGFPRKLSLGY